MCAYQKPTVFIGINAGAKYMEKEEANTRLGVFFY